MMSDLRKNAKKLTAEEWDAGVDQNFTTVLNNAKEIELCDGGKTKQVTKENVEEFIELVLKARFDEGNEQMKWIKEGVYTVIPKHILNMLTWEEIEIRTAGDKVVDLDVLKKWTIYSGCDTEHRIVKMFWSVMESMEEFEKQQYLQYVWGRQRLPANMTCLRYNHKVYYCSYADKLALPKAHTCFFQIDLPNYETEEIMKAKILMAAQFCGEIDDD